jgi:L-ascorbate metabolism protein UlaG (beta-lactamase superfamily)
MVSLDGKQVLFDPFITGNPLAAEVDIASIHPDYILISHGHGDHVQDAETIAKQSGATIVSNYEVVTWFEAKGIKNFHPMNHGGSWKFDFGRVKYVNAIHSSSLPDGANGGNPGGFIIESNDTTFYYAGDTALTMDMQLYAHANLQFAFLPIGDNFTMGIDDAVTATSFLKVKKVIGMHYDTFGFIEIDKDRAKHKFRNAEVELLLFNIGETRVI